MIATPCIGSWVAIVPASTRFAVVGGALFGSCMLGSGAAMPNRCTLVIACTLIAARRMPALMPAPWWAGSATDLNWFEPTTITVIRASSMAISAAISIAPSQGPLRANRDSQSSMRGSVMVNMGLQ